MWPEGTTGWAGIALSAWLVIFLSPSHHLAFSCHVPIFPGPGFLCFSVFSACGRGAFMEEPGTDSMQRLPCCNSWGLSGHKRNHHSALNNRAGAFAPTFFTALCPLWWWCLLRLAPCNYRTTGNTLRAPHFPILLWGDRKIRFRSRLRRAS